MRKYLSDLQKFIKLYLSLGIELKIFKDEENGNTYFQLGEYIYDKYTTRDERFEGYNMYTRLDFDKNGKFIKQGFWE